MLRKTIYVRLLDEGVKTYRPVSALEVSRTVYEIEGFDIYNPEDESWEFPPGSLVMVEQQSLSGSVVLVATAAAE
jgi:hypothetical protein